MPAAPDSFRNGIRSGYPYRTLVALATILAIFLVLAVVPVGTGLAWCLAGAALTPGAALIALRTVSMRHRVEQDTVVLAALTRSMTSLPESLRSRMPVVLVTGDGLDAIFNRGTDNDLLAHVGDGAIWLRVDNPQSLPQFAVAVRRWRDGRVPDGIVLAIAPALYPDDDALTQKMRLVRQALSDASRMLGSRLPGYLAVYQRLTANSWEPGSSPTWYGVSSATPITNASRFESVIRGAEGRARALDTDRSVAWRAAGLSALVDWTQRAVVGPLRDRLQPATPFPLYGAGWIDCGPAVQTSSAWASALQARTQLVLPSFGPSPAPWPLPQALIEAMPRRLWISPRLRALAHALCIAACAAAVAFWSSGHNNRSQLAQVGADLGRFSMIPPAHDAARRDALKTLVADRDRLQEYQRSGVPLRLSFGMYRGAALIPALNSAIASYQPPPAPPAVVTLDSMSLFDSGRAQLKPGSTRAMVGALEMIKAHPDKRILVAGYSDNAGSPDSNLKLSVARAGAVRDWLVEVSGLPVTQFAIQGYGDTRPIAGNDNADGRARNRRVEITLVPDVPGGPDALGG
ncbi:Outer membrane protein A [Paraburkholderia nemoris]|uniref:OmpA family protein n=1 Tax=Paraburkholderia nemoris TaxID=2793076 RepID=UPI00190E268C|nr:MULTISPECIES: OmpA family protein [Paraburkholderia]MBK3786419.1 OmpA family protein [Paraburkholderia aspalathi]CAE6854342.1 Outer membrane protein A [Paraburkholderia nemoris]